MTIDIVTIFPGFFAGPFEHGILRRAQQAGLVNVEVHDLRQFTSDRHRTVDDRPFGGEEGMVLKPEPLFRAVEYIREQGRPRGRVILLSAQGKLFRQPLAAERAREESLLLLCGRYEGVDERVAGYLADEELSIWDFVLSGGELAAAVVVDAVVRLLPGALGNEASAVRESFAPSAESTGPRSPSEPRIGLLDCPHYTRPAVFREMAVPEALLSGDHKRIAQWRRREALKKTWLNRPDLLAQIPLDEEQQQSLAEIQKEGTQ
ncbi:MAG: tRNA (guanosine(37)-N1)-methyltransferase TrmD [Acidobacteria bacterium RIFCSPLOWO2_12_FULL_59_11]|nr:MAG: tRNA (guanosine(37)-N1)-methyltransferase TrmD [Acidobacteria bacterium RIFCSPLOWO2_12_FULL_59_11]